MFLYRSGFLRLFQFKRFVRDDVLIIISLIIFNKFSSVFFSCNFSRSILYFKFLKPKIREKSKTNLNILTSLTK